MREIKFRQPIYSNGKFCYWHYWGFVSEGNFVSPISPLDSALKNSQQYTGLKDCRGKEIYEGDVLKPINNLWKNQNYKVEYQALCFCFIGMTKYADIRVDFSQDTITNKNIKKVDGLEIIGNICENKELLK